MHYEDIAIGSTYAFERAITQQDVEQFSELTGDQNPLHTDKIFATRSPFQKPIVHGMLAGSLFSCLVGMHCPGKTSLYVDQTLHFRQPIFPGDTVIVRGKVIQKTDSMHLVRLKTEILKGDTVVIDGEALVKVLSYDA